MRRLLISLFFIFLATFSFAQKVWTLAECVQQATENNITIKKAELNQQLSEYALTQSKLNLLPTLNASTGYYFNYGKTIDPTSNQFVTTNTQTNTLSLNTGVTLFGGLQKWNGIKQSQFDLLASQSATQKTTNDILLYVVSAFLQVVFAKENLKIAEDQVQLSGEQVTRTRRLVDAGSIAQSALYTTEAQAAQDEVTRVQADNALASARLSLAQLMNVNEPVDVSIPDVIVVPDIASMNQTVNDIYQTALKNQPGIQSAKYSVSSAEKGVSIAKGRLYPTLSFFGSLSTNYSDLYRNTVIDPLNTDTISIGYLSTDFTPVVAFSPTFTSEGVPYFKQYNDNFGQAFGLSLDIPIFNNWQSQTNVSRSKVQLLDAQYTLDAAQQQLLTDVQNAYQNALSAKNSYDAALKAENSFKKSFDDAQLKFDLGAITSIDYITLKSSYFSAQSDLIRAKYQYIFNLKVLDFYQGKPITLQ